MLNERNSFEKKSMKLFFEVKRQLCDQKNKLSICSIEVSNVKIYVFCYNWNDKLSCMYLCTKK